MGKFSLQHSWTETVNTIELIEINRKLQVLHLLPTPEHAALKYPGEKALYKQDPLHKAAAYSITVTSSSNCPLSS